MDLEKYKNIKHFAWECVDVICIKKSKNYG